jgi:t-SNARE complex subunit (syntaxin)
MEKNSLEAKLTFFWGSTRIKLILALLLLLIIIIIIIIIICRARDQT